MPPNYNAPLVLAAVLSALAAFLHVGVILGGARWYRFFGAGESMANAAAAGRWYPALVTSGIALVLAVWAAYALAGAGVIPSLPFLKWGLGLITAVYVLRGLAVLPVLVMAPAKATSFVVSSSAICLLFGAVHLVGLVQVWPRL